MEQELLWRRWTLTAGALIALSGVIIAGFAIHLYRVGVPGAVPILTLREYSQVSVYAPTGASFNVRLSYYFGESGELRQKLRFDFEDRYLRYPYYVVADLSQDAMFETPTPHGASFTYFISGQEFLGVNGRTYTMRPARQMVVVKANGPPGLSVASSVELDDLANPSIMQGVNGRVSVSTPRTFPPYTCSALDGLSLENMARFTNEIDGFGTYTKQSCTHAVGKEVIPVEFDPGFRYPKVDYSSTPIVLPPDGAMRFAGENDGGSVATFVDVTEEAQNQRRLFLSATLIGLAATLVITGAQVAFSSFASARNRPRAAGEV